MRQHGSTHLLKTGRWNETFDIEVLGDHLDLHVEVILLHPLANSLLTCLFCQVYGDNRVKNDLIGQCVVSANRSKCCLHTKVFVCAQIPLPILLHLINPGATSSPPQPPSQGVCFLLLVALSSQSLYFVSQKQMARKALQDLDS